MYFEVIQKLSECHLLSVRLQTCDLEPIPQRPLNFIVLRKQQRTGIDAKRDS